MKRPTDRRADADPVEATQGSRLAVMVLCEAALLLLLVGVVVLLLHLH